jgi:cobyrinic acid a,c-diamide synthase
MASLSVPRICIAGESSGIGKSLLVTGILVALRKRGVAVSCCVTSPALQQSLIYSRISQRYPRVLQSELLGRINLLTALYQAGLGADVIVIDGTRGIFDSSRPGSLVGSDAALMMMTGTPGVVILHADTLSHELAARVCGYSKLLPDLSLAGVVCNEFSPSGADGSAERRYQSLRGEDCARILEAFDLPPCLGVFPRSEFPAELPHIPLSEELNLASMPMQFFVELGNVVTKYIDIDRLLEIAAQASEIEIDGAVPEPKVRRCRIAVSDDSCFNVCFPDNLALLRFYGADVVPFSPLGDSELPAGTGGVYLTGGYLENYAEELGANVGMREALWDFSQRGGVIYSEGAGTAYLSKSFQLAQDGSVWPGVGVLPFASAAATHPSGEIDVGFCHDSILGVEGVRLKGMTSGVWGPKGIIDGGRLIRTFEVSMAGSLVSIEGFSSLAQGVSTYHLLNFGSNQIVAEAFVESARVYCKL